MKFHVVSVLSFFGHAKVIDAFHSGMFHGTAMRSGAFPSATDARLAFDVDRPLKLHKNVHLLAEVFAPEFELVVSDRVRNSLSGIEGLQFEPVTFVLLYSWPYAPNDFSHYKRIGHYGQQQQWIFSRRDDPRLHAKIGQYFHLVTPPIDEVRKTFPNLRAIDLPGNPNHETDLTTVEIGPDLVSTCPIHSEGCFVMTDDVFDGLSPHIDWTYFRHRTVEI